MANIDARNIYEKIDKALTQCIWDGNLALSKLLCQPNEGGTVCKAMVTNTLSQERTELCCFDQTAFCQNTFDGREVWKRVANPTVVFGTR